MTLHLLLVDDEADTIELFRQSFRHEIRNGRIALRFATSGDDALALLAENGSADHIVLLSDINMPGMSGLDLLREVKRRWPAVKVIMVSAYGDADNRRQAADLGANAFVVKPVDFNQLRAALGAFGAGEGI
jgi:CheY-like chemotaxis protein